MPEANHKPRVGIPYRTRKEELTGDRAKLEPYLEAVRQAGGDPVAVSLGLPPERLTQLAETLDAVVLSGSPADVNPALFHAARRAQCSDPDPDRERTDFTLLGHALAHHKPVLAICYGIQSLNVFLSGTLIQDIPSEIPAPLQHEWNRPAGAPEPFHPVQLEPGSRLAQLAGAAEVVVNSSHHQSILEPGRNLRVAARARDGVVEAVEWTGDAHWVIGVQWHPERMATTDSLAQALFRGLIAATARKTPARA